MKNVLYMHFHYLKNSYRTMYVKQENQLQNRNRKRNENTETKKKNKTKQNINWNYSLKWQNIFKQAKKVLYLAGKKGDGDLVSHLHRQLINNFYYLCTYCELYTTHSHHSGPLFAFEFHRRTSGAASQSAHYVANLSWLR